MPHRTLRETFIRRQPFRLPATATVREAAQLMAEERIGAVLVMEGEVLRGIFTERDALYRVVADGLDTGTTKVGDVMTASVVTLTLDDTIADALRLMRDMGFRHLPLVEGEEVCGILSLRDFIGVASLTGADVQTENARA